MKRINSLLPLISILIVFGCAALQVSREVQSGRQALLIGKPNVAVDHFRRAAQINPEYVYNFSPLQQGVWTYLGRAYYDSGKLSEARKVLEKARSQDDHDHLARLYLGLTLARDGNRRQGLQEIEGGMRGLHAWLEDITYGTSYGEFWDPHRKIRSQIQDDLAMISGKEIDWQKLIVNAEWTGRSLEAEIDLARRDERMDRRKDGDNDRDN